MNYCMVYIAYHTELNLQICNFAQKRSICRENSKYKPDEILVASFGLAKGLPNSATLMLRVSDTHWVCSECCDANYMFVYEWECVSECTCIYECVCVFVCVWAFCCVCVWLSFWASVFCTLLWKVRCVCGSGSPVGIFVYIVNVRASECAGCSVLGDVTPAYLLESEARNGPLHLTYYPLSPTLTYRHHHRHGSSFTWCAIIVLSCM